MSPISQAPMLHPVLAAQGQRQEIVFGEAAAILVGIVRIWSIMRMMSNMNIMHHECDGKYESW